MNSNTKTTKQKGDNMDDTDIDNLYIEATAEKTKQEHKRKVGKNKIKVRSSVQVARDDFHNAKRLQKLNIKQAKRNIKSYKMLIKQARNTYKLVKLANK